MRLIYDLGFYDGADTAYYLASGHRVIAVEANPELVERGKQRFAAACAAGQLTLVQSAVSDAVGTASLVVSGRDIGSSSLLDSWVPEGQRTAAVTVPTLTLAELMRMHGVPYFLKVDIEGADRHAVLPLTRETKPIFLSFEMGHDWEELLAHAEAIGYTQFRIMNQVHFRALPHERPLRDRAARRVMRLLGYEEPRLVRRAGAFFGIGTSGPLPWRAREPWVAADVARRLWRSRAPSGDWYDLHAC